MTGGVSVLAAFVVALCILLQHVAAAADVSGTASMSRRSANANADAYSNASEKALHQLWKLHQQDTRYYVEPPSSRQLADGDDGDDGCYSTMSTQYVTCGGFTCSDSYSGGCRSGESTKSSSQVDCSISSSTSICYYDEVCCPYGSGGGGSGGSGSSGSSGSSSGGDKTNSGKDPSSLASSFTSSASNGVAELATKSVMFVLLAFGSLYGITKLVGDGYNGDGDGDVPVTAMQEVYEVEEGEVGAGGGGGDNNDEREGRDHEQQQEQQQQMTKGNAENDKDLSSTEREDTCETVQDGEDDDDADGEYVEV
mmetsp:Transcript_3813/g.8229  ORF Transcript_3813/g.8229 Transcript_3813/m.8229 type:complete len:310 (-) Transcript_3813:147-1076(-)